MKKVDTKKANKIETVVTLWFVALSFVLIWFLSLSLKADKMAEEIRLNQELLSEMSSDINSAVVGYQMSVNEMRYITEIYAETANDEFKRDVRESKLDEADSIAVSTRIYFISDEYPDFSRATDMVERYDDSYSILLSANDTIDAYNDLVKTQNDLIRKYNKRLWNPLHITIPEVVEIGSLRTLL